MRRNMKLTDHPHPAKRMARGACCADTLFLQSASQHTAPQAWGLRHRAVPARRWGAAPAAVHQALSTPRGSVVLRRRQHGMVLLSARGTGNSTQPRPRRGRAVALGTPRDAVDATSAERDRAHDGPEAVVPVLVRGRGAAASGGAWLPGGPVHSHTAFALPAPPWHPPRSHWTTSPSSWRSALPSSSAWGWATSRAATRCVGGPVVSPPARWPAHPR